MSISTELPLAREAIVHGAAQKAIALQKSSSNTVVTVAVLTHKEWMPPTSDRLGKHPRQLQRKS